MQKIKNDEIEAIRRKALQEKEERREKLNATRQTVYEAKRASAIEAKSASRQCGDMASSGKNYSEIEKRRKAEEERKRKEALRQQKEIERQEREHQAQLVYMKKMEEEAKRKKEAEDMIRMLEEEEKNLISRLRRTQQMQEEVRHNIFFLVWLTLLYVSRLHIGFSKFKEDTRVIIVNGCRCLYYSLFCIYVCITSTVDILNLVFNFSVGSCNFWRIILFRLVLKREL